MALPALAIEKAVPSLSDKVYAVTLEVVSPNTTIHVIYLIVATNPDEAKYHAKSVASEAYGVINAKRYASEDASRIVVLTARVIDGTLAIGFNGRYRVGSVPLTQIEGA